MDVTREVFEQQCKRRFGTANPERMRLAHWEWMVRSRGYPCHVRDALGLDQSGVGCGPTGGGAVDGPDWCFMRNGMSQTMMPDGRIICIAGEYEDWYDPDFCIYNDVIVLRPAAGKDTVDRDSGEVEIYGYPESVFAPTDFQSATLAGDRLIVIGRLGYRGTRTPGTTPIVAVDSSTYEIEELVATGPAPGWIYGHHASFEQARNAIVVRGGKIYIEGARGETAHVGAYRLHLDGLRWELIARYEAQRRFVISRLDNGHQWLTPDCFQPANVPHLWLLPDLAEVDPDYTIDVHGVRVLFVQDGTKVWVRVDGELSTDVIDAVVKDVVDNLRRATGAAWVVSEPE